MMSRQNDPSGKLQSVFDSVGWISGQKGWRFGFKNQEPVAVIKGVFEFSHLLENRGAAWNAAEPSVFPLPIE